MNIETLTDLIDPEVLDVLMRAELESHLEIAAGDTALINALNVVIAYFSVPGTYLEGAFDGDDSNSWTQRELEGLDDGY